MVDDYDVRVALAQIRLEIREIDAEIDRIRQESHFFHRMGFGRDIKDFQILALQEKKLEKEAELDAFRQNLHQRRRERPNPLSVLLLPVVLLLMAYESLSPKRSRELRERVFSVSLRTSAQAAD
ncbi:MAG: hypothetical protein M1358_10595 [Chloroflexi bacterium]|nr:hypothetical protein [Chloroflexota bacterium]